MHDIEVFILFENSIDSGLQLLGDVDNRLTAGWIKLNISDRNHKLAYHMGDTGQTVSVQRDIRSGHLGRFFGGVQDCFLGIEFRGV